MKAFVRTILVGLAFLLTTPVSATEGPPGPQQPSAPAAIVAAIQSIQAAATGGMLDERRLVSSGWEAQTPLLHGRPLDTDWHFFTRGQIVFMAKPDGRDLALLGRLASLGDYDEVINRLTASLGQPTGHGDDGTPVWLSPYLLLEVSHNNGQLGLELRAHFFTIHSTRNSQ